MYFFFFLIFTVTQLQLYAFSPHASTPPQLNPPPSPTPTLPLDFVNVTFIVVPVIPSPHCPLPTPPWLLLDCSFFLIYLFTFIQLQLSAFSPLPSTTPPTSLPPTSTISFFKYIY